MPSSPRQNIKRDIDNALKAVVKQQAKLIEIGQLYKKDHPDYYEEFSMIVSGFELIKPLLVHLRDRI